MSMHASRTSGVPAEFAVAATTGKLVELVQGDSSRFVGFADTDDRGMSGRVTIARRFAFHWRRSFQVLQLGIAGD
jgi:hypothetical protein